MQEEANLGKSLQLRQ